MEHDEEDRFEEHDEPLTHKEVAKIMNLSVSQVVDIEARALRKLKRNPRARKLLEDYILT